MKGKKYSYSKDDRGVTHAYAVVSVLDNPSDNEKFETFVAKKFMRSHTAQFAQAINGMSKEALDVIKSVTSKFDNFLGYSKNADELMTETLDESLFVFRGVENIRRAATGSKYRLEYDILTEESAAKRLAEAENLVSGAEPGSDAEKEAKAELDKLKKVLDMETTVSVPVKSNVSDTTEYDLTKHGDCLRAIDDLGSKVSYLNSLVTRLESSLHKLMDSGANQLAELPEVHADHVDRIVYKMNKEIKSDSNYLFNLYLTFRSKHYQRLIDDFKREYPKNSIAGLKIRGAHKTYENADAQAKEISKIDDYMDTYIIDFGKWIPLPIRTDYAQNIVYREEERELQELLGARMEESEKIKQSRREGKDVTDLGI